MHIKPVVFLNKILTDSPQSTTAPCQAVKFPVDASWEQKVIAAIRTVYDPEIHVNVYDLGLIYNISINDDTVIEIDMTLTAPACPVAEILPAQVAAAIKSVEGIQDATVNLVWDPPWTKASIGEAAQLELGLL